LRAKAQPIAILTLKNRTLSAVAQLFIEELLAVATDHRKGLVMVLPR
jgi:hypothetical protein